MFKNFLTELKTSMQRKYTLGYGLGIIALVLIANIAVVAFRLIYGANEGTYAYNVMEYATWCFVIPYYTCIFLADIAIGKGGKVYTIKNYLTKLLVSAVIGIFFILFASIVLVAITSLFQIKDNPLSWYSISDFIGKLAVALPLWLAGVSFGIMFLFVFNKKLYSYIGYFIVTLIIPRIILFFAAEPYMIGFFRTIRTYTITQSFKLLPYPADPARNVTLIVALGFIYAAIATIIGCVFVVQKAKKERENNDL